MSTWTENGYRHLSKDKYLGIIASKYGPINSKREGTYFNNLIRSIIFQQLSGKAAGTIYNRFLRLFDNQEIKPADVLKLNIPQMRAVGISNQKGTYILSLTQYFLENENRLNFNKMDSEDIREKLIQINGIGNWTIDMFLMFTLQKPDILPVSDLGIQKGLKELFGLEKLPDKSQMSKLSNPWRPYRTLACMYLWKIVDEKS